MQTRDRVRRARLWILAVALGADLVLLGLAGFVWQRGGQAPRTGERGVIVGTPVGVVVAPPSLDPSPSIASMVPTPSATTEAAGPDATTMPTTQAPTPAAPSPSAAPAPRTPSGSAPGTIAAARVPIDTVAAFYTYAERQEADAAYTLWSERMRAEFPRQENLDGRFDATTDITITTIYVAEQFPTTAKVQIEFVETYASGSSRSFMGWWDLVMEEDTWLLDRPNF